jgi:hypothetical protein
MATDRFVEMCWPNGSFGAPGPNSGSWSTTASGNFKALARNLTFGVSANQVTRQLLVVTANIVPIADTGV